MVMLSSTLASSLASNPNVDNEAAAITNFTNSWVTYFSTATAGVVPIVSPLLQGTPAAAMIGSMTGLSQANNGANAISSGITAFWTAMIPLAATLFPTAVSLTPPPAISTIATALVPVFLANTQGNLDVATCYQNIATALNAINIAGGIAVLIIASVPTPTPIL